MAEIIIRHNLKVANGMEICSGAITRRKVRQDRVEESIIDLVIVSDDLVNDLIYVDIDEKRDNVLTRITKSKGKVTVMESDHHTIISKLNIKHNKQISSSRLEMFNLKNKECQIKFKVITNEIT